MNKFVPVWLLAVLLTGCSTITLVDNQQLVVADGYTVQPQRTWSRFRDSKSDLWTVDGFALQAIRFFDPIADGGSLFVSPNPDDKFPAFRSAMLASEIEELVVDSLRVTGAQEVKALRLSPAKLGAVEGFRFELEMLSPDGLELSGLVTGAVTNGKLYLVSYTGTRAHYFPRYLAQVERLFSSLRLAI